MDEATSNIATLDSVATDVEVENPQAEILMLGQRSLDEIAADIFSQKSRAAQSFIQIGKSLAEAKEQLPKHGQWLKWLSDSVDISERMAQRYMQLARTFPTSMSDLGMTKLLTLTALPKEYLNDFINERHEIDGKKKTIKEMSTREVKRAIHDKMDALYRETDEYWIIQRRTPYTSLAAELESAQKHLDSALKFLERQKRDPSIEAKFIDNVRFLNKTAQKCLALVAAENLPDSE